MGLQPIPPPRSRSLEERRLEAARDAYVAGALTQEEHGDLVEAILTDDRDAMARSILAAELVGYAIGGRA